ncbi:outer membrane protein [Novosphingobium sp. JCM 18896]|uniref:outer membrane protein n=1 Tax=Novosphingobium sp. JCM 18896 TaxID=2989731 RepID=UPI00222141CC|nr:outer membrane beta-barrel protein [Novosphingobium sp. JCM 18896]MCW1432165.1 outer membrane beta-barrel protein [Novosphingobium sp. JCM 18896]
MAVVWDRVQMEESMRKFATAIILSLVATTPALAQEGYRHETYAGVIGGWDRARINYPGASASDDGVVYGGVIGIQTSQERSFMFGVEGEVTGSTTKETVDDVFTPGDTARVKMGRDLFIGARAGIRPSRGLLIYGKVGYTNARMTAEYTGPATNLELSDNLEGYRVGGGVEFGEGALRFRGEYRYSNYGDVRLNGVATGINPQRHQVVAGALFAF